MTSRVLIRKEATAADGMVLAYSDYDPGSQLFTPVLVLLHSLGSDSTMWDEVIPLINQSVRILVPDARGHGRSSTMTDVTVKTWADDIATILDDADVARATIAGISMGGIQALAFALAHPRRASALLVADSFAQLDADVAEAKIDSMAGAAERETMAKVGDDYAAATFVDPYPRGADAVRRAIAGMDAVSYVASVRACFGVQILDKLGAIDCPVRVAWGDRDDKAPRACSEAIVDAIDGASLGVIPAAGHLANIDNPEGFAAELREVIGMGNNPALTAVGR